MCVFSNVGVLVGAVFAPLSSAFAVHIGLLNRPNRDSVNLLDRFASFCCPEAVFHAKWSTLSSGIL